MNQSRSVFALLVSSLLLCLAIHSGFAAAREQVNSEWTKAPPTIDGKFNEGEWTNLQIVMRQPIFPIEAYAYFENDASNLYVLVDSVSDITDVKTLYTDDYDECLLVFNFDDPIHVQIVRKYGGEVSADFFAAMGFGPSPNSTRDHRICEFSIPLDYIHTGPGKSVDLSAPEKRGRSISYDAATGADNIWPKDLVLSNIETWGILVIAKAPQTRTTTAVVETPTQPATTTTQQVTTRVETRVETGTTEPTAAGTFPFETWAIAGVIVLAVIGALGFYATSRNKKKA